MECLYGIIGENNSNNKKINSFAKSWFCQHQAFLVHTPSYILKTQVRELSKADHEMNTSF